MFTNFHLVHPYLLYENNSDTFVRRSAMKRTAFKTVGRSGKGRVVWLERFSFQASKRWNLPIDFLFIDGDHSEKGVTRDWTEWSPFVSQNGVVLFHDARIFHDGWPTSEDGPVQVVNRLFRQHTSKEWRIVDEIDSIVAIQRTKATQ